MITVNRPQTSFSVVRALAVLASILTTGAPGLAASLKIGDPAPPLQVAKWVQGDPVQSFNSNHVYIVAFWATSYAPCQTSLARLNGIWLKYQDRGLIVLGLDVLEQDDNGVPAFVKAMGDKMTYPAALDDKSRDPEGAMAVNWLFPANRCL